jgi:uncharacterized protein (TIGR02118 family)
MSFEIVVCYGQPDDLAAFDDYYRTTHLPLARQVPGLSELSWGRCASLTGDAPPYYAVANLRFDTDEALQKALASPEMKAAGRDVRNFATGGATMYTRTVECV